MNRKNILFVLPFMPYPLESGGHQALFNGIKAVCEDYNVFVSYEAVDCADFQTAEAEFQSKLPSLTLLPLLHPEPEQPRKIQLLYGKIKGAVKNMLGIHENQQSANGHMGWVGSVCPLWPEYAKHLSDIFLKHHFDIVQVEMPWMIGAVFSIPKDVKKVFVHHEIGFVRHELELNETSLAEQPIAHAYAEFAKMVEIDLLNKYDKVVTLSDVDRQKLVEAGVKVPIITSFATIDTEAKLRMAEPSKVLSFVGADTHRPNYVGIKWFLENCWGELREKDSEYRLRIIGKWTEKNKDEILSQYSNISFLGFIDDLGAALDGTIMIVPITIGSGIRMKILEASSRGVPFVSTSIGAEGLPMKDGVSCMIRDDASGFVEAILSLQDPSVSAAIATKAYETMKCMFSFDALKKSRLEALYF